MSEKISRRKFAALAIGAAAAVAEGTGHGAQGTTEPAPTAEVAGDMAAIERKLGKPLSAEAKKLTLEALKNNKKALEERYKFDLPENSEPCTRFVPKGAR